MSGTPGGSNVPPNQPQPGSEENVASGRPVPEQVSPDPVQIASGSAPFFSQYSNVQSNPTGQQRQASGWVPSGHSSPQYGIVHAQDPSLQSFNMAAMAGAMPEHTSLATGQHQHPHMQQPYPTQRSPLMTSNPSLGFQYPQQPQYAPQMAGQNPQGGPPPIHTNLHYGTAYVQGHVMPPGAYGQYGASPTRTSNLAQPQQHIPGYGQPTQFYYAPVHPTGYPAGPQMMPGFQPGNRRASFPSQGMPSQYGSESTAVGNVGSPGGPFGLGSPYGNMMALRTQASGQEQPKRQNSESGLSSIPRGPPRKPKQSGHALWVGNLPPGTTVTDLKDHFSREATKDIESLFLISKSNCAFVNYRTEAACAAAMQRFHDSRLHGVRLVCRLRRSSAPAPGSAPGASTSSPQRSSSRSPQRAPTDPQDGEEVPLSPQTTGKLVLDDEVTVVEGEAPDSAKLSDRYFIVKSLTLQDLELSVKNGIWATQSHNEESLNKAYEESENVYLIFSANKSGEYFGYARMISAISEDASEIMKTIPKPDANEPTDAPKSIPTPATEWAPKGRIIDDSARGTIFWEADLTDSEDEATKLVGEEPDGVEAEQIWGKPFKVEWVSTNRLPFYRTRGLRNPWNANREVKIARDGTELETNVGKRLLQMFHRLGPSSAVGPSFSGAQPGGSQALN